MNIQLPLTPIEVFTANEDQCPRLAEFLISCLDDIDCLLVRDLSFISQLAHYKGGMKITHVGYLQDNLYQVYFMYTWHIFHGCMGMDETGEMKDKANFTVSDTGLIESDLSAFQALSTADEL